MKIKIGKRRLLDRGERRREEKFLSLERARSPQSNHQRGDDANQTVILLQPKQGDSFVAKGRVKIRREAQVLQYA